MARHNVSPGLHTNALAFSLLSVSLILGETKSIGRERLPSAEKRPSFTFVQVAVPPCATLVMLTVYYIPYSLLVTEYIFNTPRRCQ